MTEITNPHTLLICTLGGTPKPISISLSKWKPDRVHFICSDESKTLIKEIVLNDQIDYNLNPGQYESTVVEDPQNFSSCVEQLRKVESEVHRWRSRGDNYIVIVDFTGGTKCMSAALALAARRWQCQFSYVGGMVRNKDGLGIVVSGNELVTHSYNPWVELGYQIIEDAVTLFNGGSRTAASQVLEEAIKNMDASSTKRKLSTLKQLVDAHIAWDQFDFKKAVKSFKNANKNVSDLEMIFGTESGISNKIKKGLVLVTELTKCTPPCKEWIIELLNNAQRRAHEERFDDAVARLYRATEAIAQWQLMKEYNITDTSKVPLNKIPKLLRDKWENKQKKDYITISLQDSYLLLETLDDQIGKQFFEQNWHVDNDHKSSPLTTRNNSILAHGYEPVTKKTYDKIMEGLKTLFSDCQNPSNDYQWNLPSTA